MKILVKYHNATTYMYPNGEMATPERVLADFPAVAHFTHIIETDSSGEVLFAMMNLSALRSQNNIDPLATEGEAIVALETLFNTIPEPSVTASDRIAAALEFQNLMSL